MSNIIRKSGFEQLVLSPSLNSSRRLKELRIGAESKGHLESL